MTRKYLKKASLTSTPDATEVHEIVRNIHSEIAGGGEEMTVSFGNQGRSQTNREGDGTNIPPRGHGRPCSCC